MELRLLLQPFTDGDRIGDALAERADDATAFWMLAAWAQESGLSHLQPIIETVRARGGAADAILGVDQGIATIEGLRLARRTFGLVHLFHDGRRTFHPKLYVIETDESSRIVVGSGNVTEGGLYTNYEAAAVVDLDRSDPLDEAMREEARQYFESFIAAGMPARRLDLALIRELQASDTVVRSSQLRQRERDRRRREEPVLRKLFGGPVAGLPEAPSATKRRRRRRSTSPSGGGIVAAGSVAASWWKKLERSDVMRKRQGNQRRYVILNQARHPIDEAVYFRSHLFAGVHWTTDVMRTKRTKEIAVIPFDVRIGRRRLGMVSVSVDHAAHREAKQGNSPTYLNWSSLRDEILARDYTGWYLVLERYSNGGFRLRLTEKQPGAPVVPSQARVP